MLGRAIKMPERSYADQMSAANAASTVEEAALFEALNCELHWTALQIAAVTSVMNACLANKRKRLPASCRNLFPVEATVVGAALHSFPGMAVPQDITARVQRVYLNLANAKHLTESVIDMTGAETTALVPYTKLQQITLMWRKLAKDTLAAIQQFEPESRWRLGGQYSENTLILGRFLREAIEGRFTSVDSRGDVAMPVLPQRRRSPRFRLSQTCRLLSNGAAAIGLTHDISRASIGVSCNHLFKLKDVVFVELNDGRQLQTTVVWSKDGRYTLRFEHQLTPTDLLLPQT